MNFVFLWLFGSSVSIYLFMEFIGLQKVGLLLCLLLPAYFSCRLTRPNMSSIIKKAKAHRLEICLAGLLIFAHLAVMGFVLSPMVRSTVQNGYHFYQFTGINDYYKHVYTLTSLLQSGLPPVHPYYPPAKLSFYYGYYLIPAAIAHISGLAYNWTMMIYPLITTGLSLIFLYYLSVRFISKGPYRLLALLILIVGTGLDIIATLKLNNPAITHIESWSQELSLGLIVNNTFMSFLWVPHHVLAAVSLIFLTLRAESLKRVESIYWGLGMAFILLTSFFVGLTAVVWAGLIFIFRGYSRTGFIKSAIISGLILIPYLTQLSDRNSLFYFYQAGFFTFVPKFDLLNRIINLIIEYGPVTFLVLLLLKVSNANPRSKILYMLMGLIPVVVCWFIRTPGPNDFGMRSILSVQLLVPVAIALLISGFKSKLVKLACLILVVANLTISGWGYAFEHLNSWKDRRILNLQESSLVHWTRSLPQGTRLASYQKYDWAFYIPPMGFKTNLTPHLFDSGVYISGDHGYVHSAYEQEGIEVFGNVSSGQTIIQVIESRNLAWTKLSQYLNFYPFDYFVFTRNEWVKKGVNVWYEIFRTLDLDLIPAGVEMAAVNSDPLLTAVDTVTISIDSSTKIAPDKTGKLNINPGLWFISACSQIGSNLKVEFEDYFSLLDTKLDLHPCFGRAMVVADDQGLQLTNNTTADIIEAYPVLVLKSPLANVQNP